MAAPGEVASGQYRAVWQLPGAPSLLVTSAIGRLGLGITPLALLLLVADRAGTYTPAAVAGAAYALCGAAAAPVAGRIADRAGPAPVLRVLALAHPLALLLLLGACWLSPVSLPLIWLAAGLAGATFPPVTASVRGAWNAITAIGTPHVQHRSTAMAAESVVVELVFVLGPILVAGFVAFLSAGAAIGAAAVVTLFGTLLVARVPVMRDRRPQQSHERTRGLGPLKVLGFPALLVCGAGLGFSFGAAGIAIPAYAASSGVGNADSVAGILLAVWGLGSATGGFWFGTRTFKAAMTRQFAVLLVAVGASFAVLTVMPNPVALGIALAIGGATIAPALTVNNQFVGRIVPSGMHNEAYTWVITISVAFSALGGAVTGIVIDHGGVHWAFAISAATLTLVALVAARPHGSIARAEAAAGTGLSDS